MFRIASCLADPLCLARQYRYELYIAEKLYPRSSSIQIAFRNSCIFAAAVAAALTATLTTPIGIVFHALASNSPYTHQRGKAEEKAASLNFSLLSWNVCAPPAGYCITDGGVAPIAFRIKKLISEIQVKDADMVCLFEVFDVQTAKELISGLEQRYSHFFYNMGLKWIGPSSGMFIASKFAIENPTFVPFPEQALDGRSKYCGKGFVCLPLPDCEIIATHLGHSEITAEPTEGEKNARRQQMQLIAERVNAVAKKVVVVTGDLNASQEEMKTSPLGEGYTVGKVTSLQHTWGGDKFCAKLMNKQSSPPSTLDYTLIRAADADVVELRTDYVQTGFNQKVFSVKALSDHLGLYSIFRKKVFS